LSRAAWAAIVLACVFFGVSFDLLSGGPLSELDVGLADWMRTHRSRLLEQVLLAVTHTHAQAPLLAASAAIGVFLAWRRQWTWLTALVAAVPGAVVLNHLLKLLFERARPRWEDPLLSLSSFSFPSGHTAGATAFYGFLAAYALAHVSSRRGRTSVLFGAAAMVVLVALSRMVLGVHYLSDVLAAVASTGIWLVLCLAVVHAAAARRR
jgi:membrane-associated phospholipid phosphatase